MLPGVTCPLPPSPRYTSAEVLSRCLPSILCHKKELFLGVAFLIADKCYSGGEQVAELWEHIGMVGKACQGAFMYVRLSMHS